MKACVWINPYKVSYGTSLVIAIANSLPEARKQAAQGKCFHYGEFEYPNPGVELGKPDRVLTTPIAEWSE